MLLLTLASGELETYRFQVGGVFRHGLRSWLDAGRPFAQITAFLSIATVFAVIGTNMGIFGSSSYQTAIGAGWLLLSIVDVSGWVGRFVGASDPFSIDFMAPVHHRRRCDASQWSVCAICRRHA